MMTPWERLERLMGRPPKATLDNDGMPLSPAVAAFRSRVTVEPVPGSRLVNLRFTAYSPAVAAQAANALAEAYIQQSLDFRFNNSTEATGWLGERLKEQQQRVEAAEKALQQYREQEGLVNFEERQSLVDQKLQTLNGAVLNARTERITKETLYNQVRNLSPAQLEAFPSVMANPVVFQLKNQLADLQKEQAKLAETLGDKHPDMLKVRSQIRATEEKLRAETRNVVRAAENDYRTAASQEANLNASLDAVKQEALGVNRKAIEFGVLKREVESNQQVYKDLLNRNKQTGLQSELKTTNIRVVEKAETPRKPISPQRTRNYQFALLIGLGPGHRPRAPLRAPRQHAQDSRGREGAPGPALSRHGARRGSASSGERQRAAGFASHPEEPAVGGGRELPRAAHQPDLLVGRDARAGPS